MERKTKVKAEEGKQEILITREFELPLELLFKAYVDPDIVAQWMGTKVLKLESKKHGSYQFETTDGGGNRHGFNGVIHACSPGRQIIRTFEMENTPFDPWIEYLDFEELGDDRSTLVMRVVYKSVAQRDQVLQMPFAAGINMAHNRLEKLLAKSPQEI